MSDGINTSRAIDGGEVMIKENGNSCVVFNGDFANEILAETGFKVGKKYRHHNKKGEAEEDTVTIEGVSYEYEGIDTQTSLQDIETYKDDMKAHPKKVTIWGKHNGAEHIGILDYKTKFTSEEDGRIKYGRHGYLVEEIEEESVQGNVVDIIGGDTLMKVLPNNEFNKNLEAVAGDVAVEMIEKILLGKDSPREQVLGAAYYMVSRYGILCAKGLHKYQGQFVWYKALGGQINDELYSREKELVEINRGTLREESLIVAMLGVNEEVV